MMSAVVSPEEWNAYLEASRWKPSRLLAPMPALPYTPSPAGAPGIPPLDAVVEVPVRAAPPPRTPHPLDRPPETKPDPKTVYEPRYQFREPYYAGWYPWYRYGGCTAWQRRDPTVYRQRYAHGIFGHVCITVGGVHATTSESERFMDDALYWGER